MTRLAVVVALALAGFALAVVVFNSSGRRGCPLRADRDASYSGRFVGPVSIDQTTHEIEVRRDGKPLTGLQLCVNTEMVGMTGMGYSAKAREQAPGRYAVRFRFEMAGDYRTSIVARDFGNEIGIPLTVKVGGGGMNMGGG